MRERLVGGYNGGALNLFWKYLVPIGRKIVRLPGLHIFARPARRVLSVAEPAGDIHIHDQPVKFDSSGCNDLRVLSANLWHDWPRRRNMIARLEVFSRLVETNQVDVLLLQEVSRSEGLWVDQWLAQRLGMSYVYARANGHRSAIGFEEGLAIFSRYPICDPVLTELDQRQNPFIRRVALGATLDTPCGRLPAFSVHLGLARRHNRAQLERLHDWVAALTGSSSALIGGDFNANEASERMQHIRRAWRDSFRHLHPHADGTTHELRWPWGERLRGARLDYVFLRLGDPHWSVVEARHLESQVLSHSDHRAVFARLVPSSR